MVVDFAWKQARRYRVASIVRVGPWKEDNLHAEFRELVKWAARQKVRTGSWIFCHRRDDRWEACLELKGEARPEGRIRLKTLPREHVAWLAFDPDALASRIVYHALSDWTRHARAEGEIKKVASVREVYSGDPWSDGKAWKNCEVQFLVHK